MSTHINDLIKKDILDESDCGKKKKVLNEQMPDMFRTYSAYVSQIPKLDQETERDLLQKAQAGDNVAREKLIKANLSLVLSQVKHIIFGSAAQKNYSNIMDQIQEGNLGLIKAIEKFDLNRDNRFSTYAVYWIKQQIRQSNQYLKTIKTPSHIVDSTVKVLRATGELEQKLGRAPTNEEVADALGISVEKVREIVLRNTNVPISLNAPIDDTCDDGMMIDILQDSAAVNPEDEVMKNALTDQIESVLKTLDERESEILKLRFGFYGKEETLEDVGKKFGITRERVRQIEAKALRKLRHPSRSKNLSEFKV